MKRVLEKLFISRGQFKLKVKKLNSQIYFIGIKYKIQKSGT